MTEIIKSSWGDMRGKIAQLKKDLNGDTTREVAAQVTLTEMDRTMDEIEEADGAEPVADVREQAQVGYVDELLQLLRSSEAALIVSEISELANIFKKRLSPPPAEQEQLTFQNEVAMTVDMARDLVTHQQLSDADALARAESFFASARAHTDRKTAERAQAVTEQ